MFAPSLESITLRAQGGDRSPMYSRDRTLSSSSIEDITEIDFTSPSFKDSCFSDSDFPPLDLSVGFVPEERAELQNKLKLPPIEERDISDEDYPLWKLAAVTSTWIGIQCLWTTEFSVTALYMEYLGMPQHYAVLTWIWGPITGFVVAPTIGAASDRCESRFGRRRPFLVIGLILMILFSTLFALAEHIFKGFGERNLMSQYFALLMFIGMDSTINVMQTPLRAFLSDLTSSRQQAVGQLMAAGFQGVGGLVGALIMLPFAKHKAENVLPVVALASGVNIVLITLACCFGKEQVYRRPEYLRRPGILEPFKQVFCAVRYMPRSLFLITIVQFFSWIGLFCIYPFKSSWWGQIAYKGCLDCNDPQGEERRREGEYTNDVIEAVANAGQVVVGMALALLLNRQVNFQIKFLYSGMIFIGAVAFYFVSAASSAVFVGMIAFSLLCIPNAAINSFPFALVGSYNRAQTEKENDTGVQMGVLNLFIVLPQVIITVTSSVILAAKHGEKLMVIVAISWTIAAIAALFVQDRFQNDSMAKLETNRESMQSDLRSRVVLTPV